MEPLLALAGITVALVAAAAATARRPPAPVPGFDGYLARWGPLHGGYDPRGNRPLLVWLRLSYAVARPLAVRGVQADVLTLGGMVAALAVAVVAGAGGRWPVLAAWVLVASGLADTLDGCVAVLTDRASRWGYVLDSLVDRVADIVYLVALVVVGGSVPVAGGAGLALFLLEYLRARAGNAGVGEIEVVTLGERPTRVILCAVGLLLAGLYPDRAAGLATGALAAVAAVCAVALVQLAVAVRRRLLG